MYDKIIIDQLIDYIIRADGINDKAILAEHVQDEFNLARDRKVYYCDKFAIRFSESKTNNKRVSNTILSLSSLLKYDDRPFIVCVVAPETNHMLLANTTFLKKISHSSQELRIDNIRGSFNGGDIMMAVEGLENSPNNFCRLYTYHEALSKQDNISRLVETSNEIVGRNNKFTVDKSQREHIYESIARAGEFLQSKEYTDLFNDLDKRVDYVKKEILIAAQIENVNIRGRVIEYLITEDNDSYLKRELIEALNNGEPLPEFKTEDALGDFSKKYNDYQTETDIKTKILSLHSNPKAYNTDKLLEFWRRIYQFI